MADVARRAASGGVDHEGVEPLLRRRKGALGVARQQDAFDAHAEPDPGRGRSAQGLGQPVVAPASAHRVLGRLQGLGRELEGGARVVVQPPHQAQLDGRGDAHRVQPFLHPVEVRLALVAQVVQLPGRLGRHLPARLALAVQHPQGVGRVRAPVLVAQLPRPPLQVLQQQLAIRGAAGAVAHGVQQQAHPAKAEGAVQAPGQVDDLHVEVGVVAADGLHPQLVVLAVAPGLRRLVAEVGGHVPGLEGRDRAVLDEGPHHRRRPLGTEGDVTPALVTEVVHLLAHEVGALPHPLPHPDVLEHGCDHQAVAGAPHAGGEHGHERLPPGRLRRQDVVRALGRLERRDSSLGGARHRVAPYPGPAPAPLQLSGP